MGDFEEEDSDDEDYRVGDNDHEDGNKLEDSGDDNTVPAKSAAAVSDTSGEDLDCTDDEISGDAEISDFDSIDLADDDPATPRPQHAGHSDHLSRPHQFTR